MFTPNWELKNSFGNTFNKASRSFFRKKFQSTTAPPPPNQQNPPWNRLKKWRCKKIEKIVLMNGLRLGNLIQYVDGLIGHESGQFSGKPTPWPENSGNSAKFQNMSLFLLKPHSAGFRLADHESGVSFPENFGKWEKFFKHRLSALKTLCMFL